MESQTIEKRVGEIDENQTTRVEIRLNLGCSWANKRVYQIHAKFDHRPLLCIEPFKTNLAFEFCAEESALEPGVTISTLT